MRFLFTTMIALGLISCAHQTNPSTPAKSQATETDNVIESSLLNANTEKALGESIFTKLLRQQKLLEVSDDFKAYTAEITKKIGENSHRPEIPYEVYFFDTKEFFVVGLPGGKILVSKNVLSAVKSESEYANLIANQIAHIAKQHLIKNLLRDSEYSTNLKADTISERIVQQSIFVLFDMGYDVNMINEADRLAPTYAMHIGYATNGLVTLLQTINGIMAKTKNFGKTDLNYNWISHRTSMNEVFVRNLEKIDKFKFPKAEDRFAAMLKKIKPVKKKKQ